MTQPPKVHFSNWWGIPTSNEQLVVYHHVDSDHMKPILAALRTHFSQVIGSIIAGHITRNPAQVPPRDTAS